MTVFLRSYGIVSAKEKTSSVTLEVFIFIVSADQYFELIS